MGRKQTDIQPDSEQHLVAGGDGASNTGTTGSLAAAIQHHRAGRHGEAATIYRRILDARPDHFDALNLLGVVMHQTGRHEAAVEHIGKAVALKPEFAEAHSNLGNAFKELGRLDEAAAAHRRAIALKPDYAEAHHNLGVVLIRLGNFAEAVAACREAVALRPEFAAAHSNLGHALRGEGDLDGAVASYRAAIALKPEFAAAHYNLGNALKGLGDLDQAVASYRRAITLKSDFAEAYNNLGEALKGQGSTDEAVVSHQTAIALKPEFAGAHNNLGVAFMSQGKPDKARACFRRAIEIAPDDARAHFNHAKVHKFVPGDPELERLKEILEIADMTDDHRNRIRFALGKAHDDLGRHAEAFSYYSAANQEWARHEYFDAVRHRDYLLDIRRAFPERRVCVTEASVGAECVPVFVVGMSRSGKSLIESLLSQHEDAHGTGESRGWHDAVNGFLRRQAISTPSPRTFGLLNDSNMREIGNVYMAKLVDNSLKSKIYVNTSAGMLQYIGMFFQTFSNVRIIYCQRDPMDNCLFAYFCRYARGMAYSYDLADVASYYTDYTNMMAHWLRLYGDRILAVRYEDLVRNSVDVGARIYDFCGLDYDPAAVENAFTTDRIGHWKHYEPYLDPLRQALGGLIQPSDGDATSRHHNGTNG